MYSSVAYCDIQLSGDSEMGANVIYVRLAYVTYPASMWIIQIKGGILWHAKKAPNNSIILINKNPFESLLHI